MILIVLGTQDKKFYRLLKEVDELINKNVINDEVIVQAGYSSDYKSNNMKIFNLIPMDEFEKYIEDCDLLITHGGVGTILTGLKHSKKVIAVPRLSKYKEHVNDHQLQIVENFSKDGYILGVSENTNLEMCLKKVKKFNPKKFESNNHNFIKKLKQKIDSFM